MEIHCKYSKLEEIDNLVPHPRNANTHSPEQLERLAKILQKQGWRKPIVVSNRSGFIVSGHGRLLASRIAGFDKVPIDEQDYASDEAELADLIADNKIAELADWSHVKLSDVLTELNTNLEDIEITGFDEAGLTELAESLYNPNFNPTIGTGEITADQMRTAGSALDGQFDGPPNNQSSLRRVTCPSCGDDFQINIGEMA
jgi:ParB-like chromosome segregation protein Spo0J